MADLSLPGYMSDIVNVGIQQNGIENAVPRAITSTEFNRLALFMNQVEKVEVVGDYSLLDKATLSPGEYASQVKKYPLLGTSSLYVLNNVSAGEVGRLDQIFIHIIPIVSGIEQNPEAALAGSGLTIPPGSDPFTLIGQLPPDQLAKVQALAAQQVAALPATVLSQYSIAYITAQYKVIGVGLNSLRNAYLWHIGLIMLGLALASAAASVLVAFMSARVAAALGRDLRRKQFERVGSFSSSEFDKFSTASLITRSTNDITQIQLLMVMLFRFVFYAPILGLGGVIKVMDLDRSMLWIILAAVVAILMLIGVLFLVVIPKFRLMQGLVDRLNLVTREFVSGLMVIRAFNTQKTAEQKFDAANKDFTSVSLFVNRAMVVLMPVMMLVMNGVMLIIIWVGSHQVNTGSLQVGDMMAATQYAMQIIFAFLMISIVFIMLPRASVAASRVAEVLDTDPAIKDPASPEGFNGYQKGLVEFRDVSFRYPGAEEDVLKHISFTAKPGQTTAIIGSTGSGKSTLVSMIMRFYDVSEGKVLVGGLDVRNVTQHDLRDRIGYVPQQSVLFSGTIESNIKYGNENAENWEVEKFAAVAQASEFIESGENRYAAAVAQGGTNFSGGQKQRLSIARALAKKPEIFIFDDSFSALDFKTDATLRRALKQETADATVLIVTQRIGPVMGAEQIVVLENGAVAGIGTHRQLIKDSPVYQEIALSQLSKEELGA
jgi:ATP-binding cassette subfamily B multidrug efflux pump